MLKQVSLSVQAPNPLQEVAKKDSAEISVADCRELNGRHAMLLLDVSASHGEIGRVVTDLRTLPNFEKIYSTESGDEESLCIAVIQRPAFCQTAMESGVLCLRCPFNSKTEELTWDILLKDPSNLRGFLEKLERQGIHTHMRSISEIRRESVLTPRQREVLGKAISLGYFEFPRKIDLTQLAQALGIKASTLSEILRSAQRKILVRYRNDMAFQT